MSQLSWPSSVSDSKPGSDSVRLILKIHTQTSLLDMAIWNKIRKLEIFKNPYMILAGVGEAML